MCIGIGVQFFIEKVPIYKAFSILSNENRLCGGGQITAEGPVSCFPD
jgi:hypothetical protein